MGFRFWRRVRIAPGLTLNLSRSSASVSLGRRGARLTVGPKGRRATVGIPGTGLFYTTATGTRDARKERGSAPTATAGPADTPVSRSMPRAGSAVCAAGSDVAAPDSVVGAADRLTLGFFRRLVTPPEERALVDGCRARAEGNESEALRHLGRATHLADGAWLAGVLALRNGRVDEADRHLRAAATMWKRLGRCFARYGLSVAVSLPITDELAACVGPDLRGVLLALVEVCQRQGRLDQAVRCLEKLRRLEPDDLVVKVSLAELLLEARPDDPPTCRRVVRLASGITNDTPLHTALLLYKARALRRLGLLDAARQTLTDALRRRKNRPDDLLRALRYERALVWEALGQHRRARSELERLYADQPDYEDVATRLGLKA